MTDFGSPPRICGLRSWERAVTPKSYDSFAPLRRPAVPSFAPAVGVTQTKEVIMPKSAHTPGPWIYEYSPWISQGRTEIPAFEIHGEEKVCDTNEDRPIEEQEANARLIAAAPDLLAAAELVIQRWSQGDLAEAVRMLDSAVAQATGSAS